MWYLQQFQFKVQHRSGTRIGHVDYLSREPTGAPEPSEEVFHGGKITKLPKFVMVIIYNCYGIFMSVRTGKVMYGLYQSVCGKTEGKSALQTCMEELWEETRIRILPNRLMWICHDHYFSCDIFELELTEEEEPQWVKKDKHDPWTIFPWDLYLEAVAKGWTIPTHQTHLKEICKVLDIPVKHVSWADEELHYYYDPEAPVNTNQEIYTDTDEDIETDDEIIEEWEPTSQQTIEEAEKLSLER